ncbi:hypothetical protein TRIP_C60465 [Candidatus Zixiibacteriota bacterium]|nr:hypothetical protein TRIP_C60465 [candidate division Zixibacteria bacterium]
MKFGNLKISVAVFFLIFLLCVALVHSDPMDLSTYSGLWFTLTSTSVMIPGTVTDPARTVARVDLKIMEGYTVDPVPQLTGVVARFTYDGDKFTLLKDQCVHGDYWPEGYFFDVSDYPATPGGLHTVTVTLSDVVGVPLPFPPHNKIFAILYFQALPVCQAYPSPSMLDLLTATQECTVEIDNQTWVPSNPDDGYIYIGSYESTTTIGSESLFRLIDETPTVELPVSVETNFAFRGFENSINYDPDKLEFLGATLEDIPNLVWDGDPPEPGALPINIKVTNSSGDFAEQSEQTFYKLHFRLKQWWEGIGTDITFAPTGNIYHIFVNGSECPELNTTLYSARMKGTITSEAYHAQLSAARDILHGGEILAKNGNHNTVVAVAMSDNFPAGIMNDAIEPQGGVMRINLNRKNASGQQVWTIGSGGSYIVGCDPDFNFNNQTFAQNDDAISIFHEAAVYHQYGWTSPQLEAKSLVWFNLQFNPDYFTPADFNNRFVPLEFLANYGTSPAQVRDITGHVYAQNGTVPSRLDWTNGTIEVVMGEFYGTNGSTEATSISRPIYLKNNFPTDKPITSFTATVTVNNSFTIGSVVPNTVGGTYNITYTKPNSYTAVLNFTANPTAIPVDPDLGFKIATITFNVGGCPVAKVSSQTPGPGPTYRSATVSIATANCNVANVDGEQYKKGKNFTITCKCGSIIISDPIVNPPEWKLGGNALPTEFALHQNYPNPFNPETIISYDVPKNAHVTVRIFNILGQQVATLVDETKNAGRYRVTWQGIDNSGQHLSSGVYLCVMKAGEYSGTIKMSLLK